MVVLDDLILRRTRVSPEVLAPRACVEAQKEVGDDIELHFFAAELLEDPPKASFAAYVQTHGVPIDI